MAICFYKLCKKEGFLVSFPLKAALPQPGCTSFRTPTPGLVACECPYGGASSFQKPLVVPVTLPHTVYRLHRKPIVPWKCCLFPYFRVFPVLLPDLGDPHFRYLSNDILLPVPVQLTCPSPCWEGGLGGLEQIWVRALINRRQNHLPIT